MKRVLYCEMNTTTLHCMRNVWSYKDVVRKSSFFHSPIAFELSIPFSFSIFDKDVRTRLHAGNAIVTTSEGVNIVPYCSKNSYPLLVHSLWIAIIVLAITLIK